MQKLCMAHAFPLQKQATQVAPELRQTVVKARRITNMTLFQI